MGGVSRRRVDAFYYVKRSRQKAEDAVNSRGRTTREDIWPSEEVASDSARRQPVKSKTNVSNEALKGPETMARVCVRWSGSAGVRGKWRGLSGSTFTPELFLPAKNNDVPASFQSERATCRAPPPRTRPPFAALKAVLFLRSVA